jgi:hypothetical protein
MKTIIPLSGSEVSEQAGTAITLQMYIQEVIDLNLNRNTKYPKVSHGFSSISEQMP